MTKHPAPFSREVTSTIFAWLDSVNFSGSIVDPFAGIGGIHRLNTPARPTLGIEIEPEWAEAHARTIVGDSTGLALVLEEQNDPDFKPGRVGAIITSPAYGNRMADSYAGDPKNSRRRTYRISLGRPLSENNGAGFQWGGDYQELHRQVYNQFVGVLRPGGLVVINMKDHVRNGEMMPVTQWHCDELRRLGWNVFKIEPVKTSGWRFGQNHEKRADGEVVMYARRGKVRSIG